MLINLVSYTMNYSFRNSGVKIQNHLFFKLLIVEQEVSDN